MYIYVFYSQILIILVFGWKDFESDENTAVSESSIYQRPQINQCEKHLIQLYIRRYYVFYTMFLRFMLYFVFI